jgi:hypothetical protein
MMVGNNLRDAQLQQVVDKTVMEADTDGDGKISLYHSRPGKQASLDRSVTTLLPIPSPTPSVVVQEGAIAIGELIAKKKLKVN